MVKTSCFAAGGAGLIPGQESNIPHATWCDQQKEKKITRLLTHAPMKQWSWGGELRGRAQVDVILPVIFCAFTIRQALYTQWIFSYFLPAWRSNKESACQCRRHKRSGFDPWSGRSPGGGNGNPRHYSCLENLMDGGAWRAIVHGVAKRQKRLSDWAHTHTPHERFYQPHFTDEEPKVQRGCMTYQKSHRQRKC